MSIMGLLMSKLEEKLAHTISVLFHPLLIPSYVLILMLQMRVHFIMVLPDDYQYLLIGMVLLTTCVLPALIMLIMLKLKFVNSLQMETQQERVAPLIIMAVFFYATHYLLKQSPYNNIFNLFMLGATILVLVSLLLNYITKISIHMVAIGGMLGTFIGFALIFQYEMKTLLFALIIVAGLTAYARLRLGAHSQTQVYSGFLLGTVSMIMLYLFT